MKAMLIPTGGYPREIEVCGLKGLQEAVGGAIDACGWVFDDAPTLYVNDEGKLACPPNRAVYATEREAGAISWDGSTVREGDLLDIICGDFVAVGFDPEAGEDRDITEEEAARVAERFGTPESVMSGLAEALRIRAQAAR